MASNDAGYATPAAMVISFAIALVVTSVTARSMSELRLAKSDLNKSATDYALSAATQAALVSVFTSDQPPPYHWTQVSLGKAYDVIAEPERAKLSPTAMAGLGDEAFAALGVADSAPVRSRLRALVIGRQMPWIADQEAAGTWRACAATFVSPYGVATALTPVSYNAPNAGALAPNLRAGEVWRIQARDPDGWQDERIVRFTGDGLNAAAVIDRRLTRVWKGERNCQDLLDGVSAG